MESNATYTVITLLLSAAGLWTLRWLYKDYCLDRFRQSMFQLRDNLFIEAIASNSWNHNHMAYQLLRMTMNGFIRYGHQFSFTSIGLFFLFAGRHNLWLSSQDFESKWNTAVSSLSPEERTLFERYKERMNRTAAIYLLYSSPVLVLSVVLAALIPVITYILFKRSVVSVSVLTDKIFSRVDFAAAVYGEDPQMV